jgi:TetR/AcrR family transcriptional regulator, mexJK operon transcriptional repressor
VALNIFEPRTLRPKGRKRRDAILKAAGQVFLDEGYEKAHVSNIVLLAGGSKALVYEQFGDKAGLFKAMMAEHCAAILRPLHKAIPQQDDNPKDALTRLGKRFMDVLCSPAAIGLQRVALSEGHKHPDIAEAYFSTGHDVAYAQLAQYLDSVARITISHEERYRLATTFLTMIQGDALQRKLAGVKKMASKNETLAVIDLAVEWLLGKIGAAPSEMPGASATPKHVAL